MNTPVASPPGLLTLVFDGLFDDAAIFPPGDAPMRTALADHLARRSGPDASFTGLFVCSAARLPELVAELPTDAELDLSVVVPTGGRQLPAALSAIARDPRLTLRAVELPAGPVPAEAGADVEQLAELTARGVTVHLELPLDDDLSAAAALAVRRGQRVKLRAGGTTATAFPSEAALAAALCACSQAGAAVKLTAGLHGALRHRDPATGFEHHGLLNVLLAVAAAGTASLPTVTRLLAERESAAVLAAVRDLSGDALAGVRRRWTGVGTCSTSEPLAELRGLGVLAP